MTQPPENAPPAVVAYAPAGTLSEDDRSRASRAFVMSLIAAIVAVLLAAVSWFLTPAFEKIFRDFKMRLPAISALVFSLGRLLPIGAVAFAAAVVWKEFLFAPSRLQVGLSALALVGVVFFLTVYLLALLLPSIELRAALGA